MNGTGEDNHAPTNGTPSIWSKYSLMEFHEVFTPAAVTIDRTISPIFYIIGVLCNPLSAYIWLSKTTRRNNSSAIYLGALSISHFLFLILHVFVELNYAWGIMTYSAPVSCKIFNVVYYVPQYLAPLLVIGFTVERYIAVCHPFSKERYCTVHRAVMVVTGLFIFSILLGAVQAIFWAYDPNLRNCAFRQEVMEGGQESVVNIWTWITEILIFGVVPLAALVFNILVICEIKSLTSRGPAFQQPGSGSSTASTVTLLTVSFYLICTWLPATMVYSLQNLFSFNSNMTEEEIRNDPVCNKYFIYYTVRKIVEEITLSNSACYFFIYCITGKHFRDRVCALFGIKCKGLQDRQPDPRQYITVTKMNHVTNGHSSITSV